MKFRGVVRLVEQEPTGATVKVPDTPKVQELVADKKKSVKSKVVKKTKDSNERCIRVPT